MNPNPTIIAQNLKKISLQLGFSDCKITKTQPAPHSQHYLDWIHQGKHGSMQWLEKNLEKRTNPTKLIDNAQSILLLAFNYQQAQPKSYQNPKHPKIARYAWFQDYHDHLLWRLKDLHQYILAIGHQGRYYVDTGPILERDFATLAGLGWNGKSCVQIHPKIGPWFFLASIVTDIPLPIDTPQADYCGACTKCIDICPTQAITSPHHLDARKCISYLTIENKGRIPIEYRTLIGNHLYGCDECLDICPWNRHAQHSKDITVNTLPYVEQLNLQALLKLTPESFNHHFRKTPIKRIKLPALLRNACVVTGNIGGPEHLPQLQKLAQDNNPLIAEHAQWAIQEIKQRHS